VCIVFTKFFTTQRAKDQKMKSTVRMKISVMICVFLFGLIRSVSLGMQIQMGISTKGVTNMFDETRIFGFYPFYAVLLVVLRKWVITCIKMKILTRKFPHKIVNSVFLVVHLFVVFALTAGVTKDLANLNASWSEFYDWLVVGIFGVLFLSFGVTGGTIIVWMCKLKQQKQKFKFHTATTSTNFIRKMAICLAIFLVCVLWRMIDFAVYKFAKNAQGKWVYSSTIQVEIYPLESTFPEVLPMFVCFWLYKARLPWEKKKDTKNYKTGGKSSSSDDSGKSDTHTNTTAVGSSSLLNSSSASTASINVSIELENRSEV